MAVYTGSDPLQQNDPTPNMPRAAVAPNPGNIFAFKADGTRVQVANNYFTAQTNPANQGNQGNTNMAKKPPNQKTTKGKTGKELEEATIAQEAQQADLAESTLPTGAEITVKEQKVQANELLSQNTIGTAPQVAPAVPVTAPTQQDPTPFQAATYQASQAAPQVGKAQAAQGQLSQDAQMQAAQGQVGQQSIAKAATQELDQRATTQYQLGQLMNSINSGGPLPPWASPAVRRVNAIMQQRGLGASSMAAAAITQAVMESGIPIAQADADKYATIQLQNLNNEQQAALQNAATFAAMDMANLNNRQQAAVSNAKAFLSIDLQNLTNEQQSNTITYQSKVSALVSDAAAQNAAKQFNAKSENDIQEFFTELGANIETANIQRSIAVQQFNTSQSSALEQFNVQMEANYEQFNANMRLEIDQSNAIWRRNVNTQNTANQNETNRQNALNLLGIQQNALNNLWQLYRDKAAWAMQISENDKDRAHNAAMQAASFSQNASLYDDKFDDFLIIKAIDNIFGG
jgi:hypothetical protein